MIYPDFKTFEDVFKNYNYIPIYLEIDGIYDTPITLFYKLCKGKKAFIMENFNESGSIGRYSYIGRNPFISVKSFGNRIIIKKEDKEIETLGSVLDKVKEIITDFRIPVVEKMPEFIGGAVGHIGYDIIRNYENLPDVNEDDLKIPDLQFMFAKEIFVYDNLERKIKIVVNLKNGENPKNSYDEAVKRLYELKKEVQESNIEIEEVNFKKKSSLTYKSNENKESFMDKVLKSKEYIKNGDIFQVVLSQRFKVSTKANPLKTYEVLRNINPSPYMFYMDFGDYKLVGSSPEILIKLKNNKICSCSIAGTRIRGKNLQEDYIYENELLNDEKEISEHLMLLDLARNDVGKISEFGTVYIDKYMKIQKFSHVIHIVSNISGELKAGYDMFDAFISCMPAGTVSGAPKVRAMEIIDELENKKRGVYAGGVGYLGFDGSMDTCIAIRTIVFKEDTAYIQAGAGIVSDSNPENEYKETLNKAGALLDTLSMVGEDIQ